MVIAVNTIIGIKQEGSAERLQRHLAIFLHLTRVSFVMETEGMIPATEVVPGDLIILSLGDRIPDDLRVIESTNMACQKAALTRESVPIDKATNVINVAAGEKADETPLGDKANTCFFATLIAQGSGIDIAVTT